MGIDRSNRGECRVYREKKRKTLWLQMPWLVTVLAACAFGLSACAGQEPSPTPTETPLPSATVTPTIVWFPATFTKTPLPSPIPLATQEDLPGLGEILFTDDFGKPELWTIASSPSAAVILEEGRLTISIDSEISPTLLTSLRSEPLLEDFYLEVTAKLNLCRAADRYGVIFRAVGSGSYYRYVLNCQGQTRFERMIDGQAAAPRDWLTSPLAPAGAPGEVTIGVWAAGAELRFFLNDRYQYTIEDSTYDRGTIGLFVTSETSTPASVSFSGLVVRGVSYRRPTSTRIPSPTP